MTIRMYMYAQKMRIVLFELNSTNMPDSRRILLALMLNVLASL